MTTVEDVFSINERNSLCYTKCKDKTKCNTLWQNECYCYLEQPVIPICIGFHGAKNKCNINRKMYISHKDECSICFENISLKNNAYLTSCGHCFHKSCFFEYINAKFNNDYYSHINCPCCRTNIGVDDDMFNRYRVNSNFLDQLENFWLCKDYLYYKPLRT